MSLPLQCNALKEVLAVNLCDTTFIPMATHAAISIGKLTLTFRCHLRLEERIETGMEPHSDGAKWPPRNPGTQMGGTKIVDSGFLL